MKKTKYPLSWSKKDFSIKIFCSIPNVATGILVRAGKANIVIDPGDGILRDLIKELSVKEIISISDVFVTHGHHDHVGGVWSLLTYLRVMNKKTPLTIYYPEGCLEIEHIHNAFEKVYKTTLPYQIKLKPVNGKKIIRSKDVSIKPFEVIHKEILNDGKGKRQVPALGYNFIYNKMKICYGGDTAFCDTLVKSAKGADLAIIEAGHGDEESDDMHMSFKEAKTIGETAKEYFLVHVPE